uniref:DUF4283 domain-containing protein n=1 Tax=Populus trichocarpa TaxID=3694 RepID=A0A2K1XI89_POPTR
MSLCSSVENVPMVSSNIEQHNQVKSGHTLRLELQDMLNSHGMRISQFQADSDVSIEKHSTVQASNVVPEMNHVLGSKVDEVKVGSHQQEQLKLRPKLNFLNALKGSDVDDNEGSKTLGISSVRNLHFAPSTMTDGRVTVAPPLDVFEDGCEFWKSTLVGHFMGQKLPYPVVNSIAKRIWSSYGLSEVLSSDNGFFIFNFDSVDHATNVLERAPWHMANRPLVLKRWQPNMQFLKDDLARVPVWVRLYNVPLEYWTIKGLSCVASAIGVPLHADHTTLLRKRLSYARVCVEIDASKTLVKEYDLRCPNGLFITISAEYEWIPSKCSNCNVFGHTIALCATNNIDNLKVVAEGKRNLGAMNSKSADNKQNQFQWQVVGKPNKGSVSGENAPLASKVGNCNENGFSTSGIHMSDCNMIDHAASDVRNAACHEDENPSSPLVLKSFREDMKQEQGAASTALYQDMDAMGGDTDGEQTDKELTSTILTTPQTLNTTESETVNQLAIKARDSLEKKKKGSKASSKKNKKSGSSPGGTGLNDPIKHSELRRLIHQERITLFGLVETRVKDKNKDNVSQLLLRSWSFLYNYDFSCRGRIWVCWNADTVKVDVFGMSDQAIHVSVTILATNISFNTSIIYGDNNASLCEALWSDIVSRSDGWKSTPWILMGDFNAIRNQSDRLGGSTTWAGTMDRLDTCIREVKVDDL